MSSRSPFQLEPRNTYRLIFSDSGVLTAKSNSWFNSIARWTISVPSWAAAVESRLLTGHPSLHLMRQRGRLRKFISHALRLHRIFEFRVGTMLVLGSRRPKTSGILSTTTGHFSTVSLGDNIRPHSYAIWRFERMAGGLRQSAIGGG